jgi:hypothetical protein
MTVSLGLNAKNSMRLTSQQIATIQHAALEAFGPGTQVLLFGSRVDDNKRGGDIDLLIQPVPAAFPKEGKETGTAALNQKIRFLSLLERHLGERKIDVVIEQPGDTRPIVKVAHATGVRL